MMGNKTPDLDNHSTHWRAPFFRVWSGQAISLIGSALVQFALVWWLAREKDSVALLATATIFSLLPGIVLGPFAGALVDRWNRRKVMIVADTSIAFITGLLVILFLLNRVEPWHIFMALFIRSLGSSFHWPAMAASTTLMVPDQHFARVAGANQALEGALNITAPPLGALLMVRMPIYAILSIDLITAAFAIFMLLLTHIPQPQGRSEKQGTQPVTVRGLFADVGAGFKYVASWPGLVIILGIATMVNFLGTPAVTLLPLLVTRVFHGDPLQLGLLQSGWGIGLVVGGLILGAWGGFQRKVVTSMVGLIGMGVGTLVTGLAPDSLFFLALSGWTLAGLMSPIANGPIFALLQARVEPEMQGRVFTLVQSLAAATTPLALLLVTPVVDGLGVRAWYLVTGITCIGLATLGLYLPALLLLDRAQPKRI